MTKTLGAISVGGTVDEYSICLNSLAESFLLPSTVEKRMIVFITLSERTTDGFVNSWLS